MKIKRFNRVIKILFLLHYFICHSHLVFHGIKMMKKEKKLFGCINIFTLAFILSILDLFMMAGFFIYIGRYSYQTITAPMKILMSFGLSALQVTAIHGIYYKSFGIILFNFVFKIFCLFFCLIVFIISIVSVLSRHRYVLHILLPSQFLKHSEIGRIFC